MQIPMQLATVANLQNYFLYLWLDFYFFMIFDFWEFIQWLHSTPNFTKAVLYILYMDPMSFHCSVYNFSFPNTTPVHVKSSKGLTGERETLFSCTWKYTDTFILFQTICVEIETVSKG